MRSYLNLGPVSYASHATDAEAAINEVHPTGQDDWSSPVERYGLRHSVAWLHGTDRSSPLHSTMGEAADKSVKTLTSGVHRAAARGVLAAFLDSWVWDLRSPLDEGWQDSIPSGPPLLRTRCAHRRQRLVPFFLVPNRATANSCGAAF